ncbi:DNA-directed RNA polymerase III subunit RPC7-like isoform X1 [Parambassis ranga]|uniref:DNA-directed RNA polymerase III subunit RPC7-like isoform X1 n=1 Tax=Parambassis ranga TaxID=210632 RepID=A0A6P7JXP6_9TELE|nr:DNA-directed RNA polymerase III subunit RPC7-like isoform X1 [Parambassis ranga]
MARRGHGRRMMGFGADSVSIARGDALPPTMQQPTPVYPAMEQKPLPLTGGEEAEYLLALKQDFRGAMRTLPGFIQPAAKKRDVERYSDKYHSSEQTDGLPDWTIDWKRFPKELRVRIKKPARDSTPAVVSRSDRVQPGQKKKRNVKEKEEVLLKLEVRAIVQTASVQQSWIQQNTSNCSSEAGFDAQTLEKKEQQESEEEEEEGEEKKKQEEEEAEGEEEYDEEEFEEETDYIMSYFDNGEDFGGDSDDNMDEAIY